MIFAGSLFVTIPSATSAPDFFARVQDLIESASIESLPVPRLGG